MDAKSLCNKLLYAESEETAVKTLKDAGYWDDPTAWRPYGDLENNYGTIGNQQSEAVAALVEKIVNAIDARLTNECLERGEDPASPMRQNRFGRPCIAILETVGDLTLTVTDACPTGLTPGLMRKAIA